MSFRVFTRPISPSPNLFNKRMTSNNGSSECGKDWKKEDLVEARRAKWQGGREKRGQKRVVVLRSPEKLHRPKEGKRFEFPSSSRSIVLAACFPLSLSCTRVRGHHHRDPDVSHGTRVSRRGPSANVRPRSSHELPTNLLSSSRNFYIPRIIVFSYKLMYRKRFFFNFRKF